MTREYTERNQEMIARYKNGDTMEAIGKSYGISRQAVNIVLKRYGIRTRQK